MSAWAACIPSVDFTALAAVRLFSGTECAQVGNVTWLRGHVADGELDRALAKIPGLQRYELLASGQIKSPQSRIPHGSLPALEWRPLKSVLVAAFPQAALAGQSRQKIFLTLARSPNEQTPSALLTSLKAWTEFAIHASVVRLASLSFAVAEDQQVLVLGQPLPTLQGTRLVNQQGIITPCGYAWSPVVDASVVRDLFNLGGEDVVILSVDGTQQIIRSEQFVAAGRSAARLTSAPFQS